MIQLKSGSCYLLKGSPVYLKCVATMAVYRVTGKGEIGKKVSCSPEDLQPLNAEYKVTVKIVMG